MTPHLLAYALSTPWALMPERITAYAAVLAQHYARALPPAHRAAEAEADASAIEAAAPKARRAGGGSIAVIPVAGAMVEWPGQIDVCDGGTSTRQVAAALRECKADDSVGQVLMVFSTPGGSVYGMPEFADVINEVKQVKPVVGIAQSLAASAGYWALSQCTEAYCAPGGEVGSIGVYSVHENITRALDAAGVDVSVMSVGKFKTEMSPFAPLSDEAKEFQMQRARDYYGMFTKAVARGRGVPIESVRTGMGEGRCLGADAALAAGMVDGVMSMDDLIAKMQRAARPTGRTAAQKAAARQREIEAL